MQTRKIVSLPAELAVRIENFRFDRRLKAESEAIRQLIELGLDTASKTTKKAPVKKG